MKKTIILLLLTILAFTVNAEPLFWKLYSYRKATFGGKYGESKSCDVDMLIYNKRITVWNKGVVQCITYTDVTDLITTESGMQYIQILGPKNAFGDDIEVSLVYMNDEWTFYVGNKTQNKSVAYKAILKETE